MTRALSHSPTTAEVPACFTRRPAQSERDPQRVSAGRLMIDYPVLQRKQQVVAHVCGYGLQANHKSAASRAPAASGAQKVDLWGVGPRRSIWGQPHDFFPIFDERKRNDRPHQRPGG